MATGDGRRGTRGRGRRPTPDEVELWRRTVRDAKPLRRDDESSDVDGDGIHGDEAGGEGTGGERSRPSSNREGDTAGKPATIPPAPARPRDATTPAASPRPLRVGDLADVDRRTAESLRRGRMEIAARLDLHGMTRAAAQDALEGFIGAASGRGLRCVLVITGKGTMSGNGGVLRREVPRWLNLPDLRPKVVACVEAQRRHGGEGALYVLLRRRRDD